jgi:hypothetical protein
MKRLLSVLATIGCGLAAVPDATLAQATGGFTLYGGPQRGYELGYYLARGKADVRDRYELEIPGEKLNSPVTKISIDYPDYYKGRFNTKKVEVMVGEEGTTMQCQEKTATEETNPEEMTPDENAQMPPCWVRWEPEAHLIEVEFNEPVAPRTNLELVFDRVKNPVFGGMFYFNCRVSTVTGPQFPQYIGTWVLAID